ncbi:1-acylglycerol-3-phosphate O-acyltransferase [Mycobacterium tuberculosis]|nr:1-acylglycerol-3-phosphate O-acyltransferase [Mycobacterium tuberculosis]
MSAPAVTEHSWLPRATCGVSCVSVGDAAQVRRPLVVLRVALRVMLALLLVPGVPLVVMPLPGRTRVQRIYCRLVLRLFGVRITVSGSPVRNLRGVLVVSGHVSWLDVFCIGSVLPGSFVARADMFTGRTIGIVARILKIIPIERASLRRLPGVVDTIARRLRAGQTVVAFPEGTTWCGSAGRRCRPSSGPSRSRVLASRLWGFLSGDVPGRNRCRPPGAATPVDISPRRRHRLDRSGLCRRRHLGAVGLPAADRAPHAGLGARRVFAAARYRSSESRAPLPVSGACGSLGAVGATPRPPARAGDLSGLAPARLPSRCCGRGLRARSASPPGPVF